MWSIDLADMTDYKVANKKGFRCIFVIKDNFGKCLWAITLKNKNSQAITRQLSNILSISKRSPLKLESNTGKEWYNSVFHNLLKNKNFE